jgi:hypothetical protein
MATAHHEAQSDAPIVLKTQGSFAVGGSVVTAANGDTIHVDHAYVQYQIPLDARPFPLVMWHGGGQFSKTWESTPDGRDGYQNICLRRGFSTYIIDQPRRGRGGRTPDAISLPAVTSLNALIFNIFRLGLWQPPAAPRFFPGVQFPQDEASLDQYWRQTACDMGREEKNDATRNIMCDAATKLFDKIGPSVLLTHSNSGQYGWLTRMRCRNVKAIVSYEPGTFVYPSDDPPPAIDPPTADAITAATTAPILVPSADFMRLTEIPIQLVYGDYIDTKTPSTIPGVDLWRANMQRAIQFRDTVNRRGGQVEILMLPDAGLKGNTHFPFSDLNNIAVADLMFAYLKAHGLD